MKNKFSFIVVVWWIMILGFLGVYLMFFAPKAAIASEEENRMLQAFPKFSFESMAEGTFTSELESFLSDKMVMRSTFTSASSSFMDMFSCLGPNDSLQNSEQGALAELEQVGVDNTDEEKDSEQEAQTDNGDSIVQVSTSFFNNFEPYADKYYQSDLSVWKGNRYADRYNFECEYSDGEDTLSIIVSDGKNTATYANNSRSVVNKTVKTLNELATLVSEDGKVYVIPAYVSTTMNNIQKRAVNIGKSVKIETETEHYLKNNVADNVSVYSVVDILREHFWEDTPLYFITDHHWTHYGALTVANAIINDMGYVATEYEDYKKTVYYNKFHGSFAAQNNTNEYDDIEFASELKPTDLYFIKKDNKLQSIEYINEDFPAYKSFLGGTIAPWGIVKTGSNTGRKALMIGDSYILAFSVAFNEYYDEIFYIDNRQYVKENAGSIEEIIKEYKIDDVFVVYLREYMFGKVVHENLMNALH